MALLVAVGMIVAGCLLARKAGAGSREALVWLSLICATELFLLFQVLMANGYLPATLLGAAILVQIAMFFTSRNKKPPTAT